MVSLLKNNSKLLPLTKHRETRGGINEKTISIRVSGFVLTYGESYHRKQFSWTTVSSMYMFCMPYVLLFFES